MHAQGLPGEALLDSFDLLPARQEAEDPTCKGPCRHEPVAPGRWRAGWAWGTEESTHLVPRGRRCAEPDPVTRSKSRRIHPQTLGWEEAPVTVRGQGRSPGPRPPRLSEAKAHDTSPPTLTTPLSGRRSLPFLAGKEGVRKDRPGAAAGWGGRTPHLVVPVRCGAGACQLGQDVLQVVLLDGVHEAAGTLMTGQPPK